MGDQPAALQVNDDAGSVPSWSGEFTRLTEGIGMMLIHVDDKSSPQFPTGWDPVGEPLFERDFVIWLLTGADV